MNSFMYVIYKLWYNKYKIIFMICPGNLFMSHGIRTICTLLNTTHCKYQYAIINPLPINLVRKKMLYKV